MVDGGGGGVIRNWWCSYVCIGDELWDGGVFSFSILSLFGCHFFGGVLICFTHL